MKILSLLIAIAMIALCFAGCSGNETAATTAGTTEPTGLTAEEQATLLARRDAAESYMRAMATVLWRAGENVDYYKGTGDLHIVAGRLYRGVPYSYAAGSPDAFYGFSTGDENGVMQISGLTTDLMGRNDDTIRRVGNDCSATVELSWAQVSSTITAASTKYMIPDNGFLRVGDYKSSDIETTNSKGTCDENGPVVMYEAYAQLQKADAILRRTDSYGHVMMITSVHVERNAKGNVDGNTSYVTVLHQTNGYMEEEAKEFDETLGEDVYQIFGIDEKFSFFDLFKQGYMPITCQELVDPSAPVVEAQVTDSLSSATIDDLYNGTFTANYFFSTVDVTIKNANGEALQTVRAFANRGDIYVFQLSEFVENPTRTVGGLDISKLAPGTYTCAYDVALVNGYSTTVRQIEFTVE